MSDSSNAEVKKGRLAVVGLGPGGDATRTSEVKERIAAATDLVGYRPYLRQAGPLRSHQRVHPYPNRAESERAVYALDLAAGGNDVVIVSSGDPGVFAMATAVIEELHVEAKGGGSRWLGVDISVLPGVTAATAAAARIGAPLGHDLCIISLSDVLKPWEVIETRVEAAVAADFVVALYNPISRHRPWQLGKTLEIIGRNRAPSTPVVVARNVTREGEVVEVVSLSDFDPEMADMRTVLIVGSSATTRFSDADGREWVYTPRHHL